MIRVKVAKIILDPVTNSPIVILKDLEEKKALPIWIGLFEANAIAMEMEKVITPRPMTHDLFKGILEHLATEVQKIVVDNLVDNTFYATIYLTTPEGKEVQIDSRPSDAIALALRTNAPIYVSQEVISQAKSFDLTQESDLLREWLESLDPEDFGKHKV